MLSGKTAFSPRSAGTACVPGSTVYFSHTVLSPGPSLLICSVDLCFCLPVCSLLTACYFLKLCPFLRSAFYWHLKPSCFHCGKRTPLIVSSSPVRGAIGIPVSTAVRSYVLAATRNTGLFISLLFSSLGGGKPGFSPT